MRTRGAIVTALLLAIGCGGEGPPGPVPAVERATVVETRWTAKTELFVEFPALVAGEISRFAIHLTSLDDFRPLTEGRVTVRLVRGDGSEERFEVEGPSRPGIFGVDVQPVRSGDATVRIEVQAGSLEDRHDLEGVAVYADVSSVPADEPDTEETIAFLKEQQWTLDFATALVGARAMRPDLRVPGEIVPRAGGTATVPAPVDGRVIVGAVPVVGDRVRRDQELLRILPPSSAPGELHAVEAARDEAAIALGLARQDRERVERLFEAGAVPERRLLEARAAEATAGARHGAAVARLAHLERTLRGEGSEGAAQLAVRSPIDGVVTESLVAPGALVQAGQALLRIVDPDRVSVVGQVAERDLPKLDTLTGAEIELPSRNAVFEPTRLLSVNRVVDPVTRTAAVAYAIDPRRTGAAVGETAFVRLFVGAGREVPAVPESAIVDDAGRPIVFVQRGGESFVRVPITVGARDSGFAEVVRGPAVGERVVTRGAYLIRLAALSTQVPAHGHVH